MIKNVHHVSMKAAQLKTGDTLQLTDKGVKFVK